MKSESPIFIVGTPRSGTTLMARILNSHCDIFIPGETHFFLDIYSQKKGLGSLKTDEARKILWQKLTSLYSRYNEPADQERINHILSNPSIEDELKNSLTDYELMFTKFMELQMEYEGKQRWGNNAPKDLFYIEEIIDFYPDAKFIACIRDPRDFLKSYKGKWKATAESEVARIKRLYHPVVTTMLWKASMVKLKNTRNKLDQQHLLEVKYESLVTDPSLTLSNICKFLDVEFTADMLDVDFNNSSDQRRSSGIDASSIGTWRDRITNEEVWIVQKLTTNLMRQFNYSPASVRVNPAKLTWIIIKTPWALIRALLANRNNTGPIIPYLIKRIRGLLSG